MIVPHVHTHGSVSLLIHNTADAKAEWRTQSPPIVYRHKRFFLSFFSSYPFASVPSIINNY